jgi:hypothetical protein
LEVKVKPRTPLPEQKPHIIVGAVNKKASDFVRDSQLTEWNVSFSIKGKGFNVLMQEAQGEYWLMTAALDQAISTYTGKDYYAMSGMERGKVRKEIADEIIKQAKRKV